MHSTLEASQWPTWPSPQSKAKRLTPPGTLPSCFAKFGAPYANGLDDGAGGVFAADGFCLSLCDASGFGWIKTFLSGTGGTIEGLERPLIDDSSFGGIARFMAETGGDGVDGLDKTLEPDSGFGESRMLRSEMVGGDVIATLLPDNLRS